MLPSCEETVHFMCTKNPYWFQDRIWNRFGQINYGLISELQTWLDKFWSHQAVKYDFTADLTGTGNQSEEVLKSQSFY